MVIEKKILIVGAGFGQIPAIKSALELGLETIVIDKNPDAIGMRMVEKSYAIDIIDENAILELVKRENIEGIMTMQTDLPIPTIGFLNDKLNLNGVSYQTAIDCSYKNRTRQRLKAQKVAQPKFEIVSSKEAALEAAKKIGFPLIVKSVDSSGSRGITKVLQESGIPSAYDHALNNSRQTIVLIEECILGIEMGAQTFSQGGKCLKVLFHNDKLATGPFMVPTGHSFPSAIDKRQLRQAEKVMKDCVEALGIEEGPANIDFILDEKDGVPKIIEVGARIGATCLPELVRYHSGIDWVKETILNSLGLDINLSRTKNIPVAAEILEATKDGVLKGYKVSKTVTQHPNLLEFEITAKIGDTVSVLRKGTDRIGKIVVKADSFESAELLAAELKANITFEID